MQSYDYSRLSVLVVDDSPHMRRLVRTVLLAIGCTHERVHEAADGDSALNILRSHQVDVVFLDWMMRPTDGINLTRTIRAGGNVPNPYVPIIMLTGHTTRSSILAARDAGVTEYLAKPVTANGIVSRLQMIVEKPRPFVRTPSFFGPDRRRKDSSFYRGPERREDELADHDVFELDDDEEAAPAPARKSA